MLPAEAVRLESPKIGVSCYPGAPFCYRESRMLCIGNQLSGRRCCSAKSY